MVRADQMIDVTYLPHGFGKLPKQEMSFHGRDHRAFYVHHHWRSLLPDEIRITISNNAYEYGMVQFRGVDCHNLINGILDNVNQATLHAIMLGIKDRMEASDD